MATVITLNGVTISSGNYRVMRILHDSSPVLDINALEIARRDGVELISTSYKPKEIEIEGWITGTSQSNLETNIDSFKQTSCLSNINLNVAYAGSTRRYVVTASSFSITRESYDVTKVRYSLKLICLAPFGIDPTEQEALSVVNITGSIYETTMTVDGSAKPNPTINYTIDRAGNLGNVKFTNNTTGKSIEVGTAFGSGDLLLVDTENRVVQLNGNDVEFEGVFPEFNLGINNIKTDLAVANTLDSNSRTGIITAYDTTINTATWCTQSFTPATSDNFIKVELQLKTASSLSTPLTVCIQTDNSNKPSGTLVSANATKTQTVELTSELQTFTFEFPAPFALTAGTKYWIVIKDATGVTFGNWVLTALIAGDTATYTYGYTNDSGVNWTLDTSKDVWFKLYKPSTSSYSVDWEINYYPKYL